MHKYIANDDKYREEMLKRIGVSSIDDLFEDIPDKLRFERDLNLPEGKSEQAVRRHFAALAKLNRPVDDFASFLGGGVYDHYVPSVINHIISRSEYYTSYTPYQPEINQGTLQAIFEYQTLILRLTGMEATNASVYDGSNAVAEAALMAIGNKKKATRILVSEGLHPDYKRVLETYLYYRGIEVVSVPLKDGVTDFAFVDDQADGAAAFIMQNPNYYGNLEDVPAFVQKSEEHAMISIECVDPISLGILEAPGKQGVDIVVGEGQALGNGLNFGGPYFGFIAVGNKLVRKLPGRVVGLTKDKNGKRAFVLTLQAREQHIRRYKATSNICSNQSLNMLMASIYLTTLGKKGLREVAVQSTSKAHYLQKRLLETGVFTMNSDAKFFKEFTLNASFDLNEFSEYMAEQCILPGIIEGDKLIVAVTECRTKEEMDAYVNAVRRFSDEKL